jgi:O-antigen/teichoic acid export membrane protein
MDQAPRTNVVRRSVISLFIAYGISFIVVGVSYVLYSHLLSPAQFGLYSAALAITSFGTLVLDGGLKNTIIKSRTEISRAQQSTLLFLMVVFSLLLVAGIALLRQPLEHFYPTIRSDYIFLGLFGAIYLLSYPFLSIPTAFLERRFEYGKLAWIESSGAVLERASPVCFLLFTGVGIYAFVWGLLLGRLLRVISINLYYRTALHIPSWLEVRKALHLVREGTWLQVAAGASFVRDNLHVLAVAPLFGRVWVGYYGWGLQLCLLSSQIFVQISSRVSIPYFAQSESFERRWQNCLKQVRMLTILMAPVLLAMLLILPGIDDHFFDSKWRIAITILPLLFARMLPALATTPIGTLLMVERGGRTFALANVAWSAVEAAGAVALLLLIGPTGLAWSYAVLVWVGLAILLVSLGANAGELAGETLRALLGRPSLAIAAVLAGAYAVALTWLKLDAARHYQIPLILSAVVLVVAYLSEHELRAYVAALLRSVAGVRALRAT